MLVWINKSTEEECQKIGVGSAKFYCGRKKKFGLNLPATATSNRKFIALSIKYPGSSSDFMAFENSDLRRELETNNFLHPDLCLFGDNAYVNTKYMATPYPNVKQGSRDAYNFYHSQLRICVDCAFGMLVGRWGILRTPSPLVFSIKKVCKLVQSLCSLHNFLIDDTSEYACPSQLPSDDFYLQVQGAVPLRGDMNLPTQLLGGGHV